MRCRYSGNDLLQHLLYIQSCLGRNLRCVLCLNANHILNLVDHTLRFCTWQINLVDHRKYIQIMLQCHINIGKSLCLNALCSIYYQNGSVAGCQTTGNFVVKVYMTWCIYKIKNIFFSVLGFIYDPDCLGLNSNTTLSLQIHIIQNLRLHLTLCKQTGLLYDSVRQCGFAMVYMSNDTKITDFALICHPKRFLLAIFRAPL